MGMRSLAALLCAGSVATTAPARAAACWDAEQTAAATVRDLQSKMMVATMQCHAVGIEIAPAYNGFIRTNRARLESINGTIKARFAAEFGTLAQSWYDKFTTSLANAYGADRTDAEVCAAMRAAAGEAEALAGDLPGLLALAERLGVTPQLPGGRCPAAAPVTHLQVAAAVPVPTGDGKASPTVLAAATPADVPEFTQGAPADVGEVPPAVPATARRPALTLAGLLGDAAD